MKRQKQTRLSLGKSTIQNLDFVIVDKVEQKNVQGGSGSNPPGTTNIPKLCKTP